MTSLRNLPASRVGADDNWPRGHWISNGGLSCVHPDHGRGKRGPRSVPMGEIIYLTGVPGEVLCAEHAPPVPK